MKLYRNLIKVLNFLVLIQLSLIFGSRNDDCIPFQPSFRRRRGLKYFREGNSKYPLLFWHVQKSGGTTFCNLLKQVYPQQLKHQSTWLSNQNCKGKWRSVIHGDTYNTIYNNNDNNNGSNNNTSIERLPDIQLHIPNKVKNKYHQFNNNNNNYNNNNNVSDPYSHLRWQYMAIEPADEFKKSWPESFHNVKRIQNLLNSSNRSLSTEWNELVQILLIRNPIERAMSSFNYKYFGWKSSILQSCTNRNVSVENCLQKAIHFMKTGRVERELWTTAQVYMIQNQVLDNFLMNHLTIDGNVNTAIENLKMFSAILDLSYTQHSIDILNFMFQLSLKDDELDRRDNAQATPTIGLLSLISNNTRSIIEKYLSEDILIYKSALENMKSYHRDYIYPHKYGR